jgi:uncharacterized membrane protein YidH (DUF202 family)
MTAGGGLAAERTALAWRRTMLGLVLNAALLVRLPPLGVVAGAIVLTSAATAYLLSRQAARPQLWAMVVVTAGILDAVTVLLAHH